MGLSMRNQWYHLVARTHAGLAPFWSRDQAVPLWRRLRSRFAHDCLAAVLMPNHIHLLVRSARPAVHKRALATELRAYTRQHFPGESLWQKLPDPELVRDRQKLENVIRYIHLNPCRKRYTSNPWAWEWTTLHDHSLWVPQLPGVPGPWVSAQFVEESLGCHAPLWAERHRTSICMDPFFSVEGDAPWKDLATLDEAALHSVVAWATGRTESALLQRGAARDFIVQVRSQLYEPGAPTLKLSARYRVSRQRMAMLRRDLLPARVRLYLERLSYLQQMAPTQRGRNSHSRA
jgi:REP element-mobilizing transposase RayT